MRQGRDVVMSEGFDTVPSGSRLRLRVIAPGMLAGLAGMLLSGQMILFPMLLCSHPMGVLRQVLEFGGALMVFVL